MTGTVTIQSSTITGVYSGGGITGSTGTASTKVIGPLTISALNPVIAVTDLAFASGTTTAVTPPNTATGVVITPPASNQIGLTICGATYASASAIPISPNQPTVITFSNPSGQSANFNLTSAAAITGNVELSYF